MLDRGYRDLATPASRTGPRSSVETHFVHGSGDDRQYYDLTHGPERDVQAVTTDIRHALTGRRPQMMSSVDRGPQHRARCASCLPRQVHLEAAARAQAAELSIGPPPGHGRQQVD